MKLVGTPERRVKSGRVMEALRRGNPGGSEIIWHDPDPQEEFIIWGHKYNANRIVPRHRAAWWMIDNGYNMSANQKGEGYYSLTPNGPQAQFLKGQDRDRLPVPPPGKFLNPDGPVVIAYPGTGFGQCIGFDYKKWTSAIGSVVRKHTEREVIECSKKGPVRFRDVLEKAWCVVTHSSKAGIAAMRAGIPVIADQSSFFAPICATELSEIEYPKWPTEEEWREWWASLMAQQFTLDEMREGLPWRTILA